MGQGPIIHYDEGMKLEAAVDNLATEVGIAPERWQQFRVHLTELKQHNAFMYDHSLRVGIYALGLARMEGQTDLRFPLFAGCGHDIGKCEIDNGLLDSKNLTPEQFEHIKAHSMEGYVKFKDSFLFTGLVAGLHHKFKPGGYGIDLETDVTTTLAPETKQKVEAMAKLVMIADFFDALTTRNNNKGLIDDPSDPEQQLAVMTEFFPDQPERVKWLIDNCLVTPR